MVTGCLKNSTQSTFKAGSAEMTVVQAGSTVNNRLIYISKKFQFAILYKKKINMEVKVMIERKPLILGTILTLAIYIVFMLSNGGTMISLIGFILAGVLVGFIIDTKIDTKDKVKYSLVHGAILGVVAGVIVVVILIIELLASGLGSYLGSSLIISVLLILVYDIIAATIGVLIGNFSNDEYLKHSVPIEK